MRRRRRRERKVVAVFWPLEHKCCTIWGRRERGKGEEKGRGEWGRKRDRRGGEEKAVKQEASHHLGLDLLRAGVKMVV